MRQAPRAIGAREEGGLAHNTNDSQTDTMRTHYDLSGVMKEGAVSPSLLFPER